VDIPLQVGILESPRTLQTEKFSTDGEPDLTTSSSQ
jgi:hypothetical protein